MSFGWVSDPSLLTGWLKADEESTSQGDCFPKHNYVFLFPKGWDLPSMCQCSVFSVVSLRRQEIVLAWSRSNVCCYSKSQVTKASVLVPQCFLCQCFLCPQSPGPCALGEEPLCAAIDSVK